MHCLVNGFVSCSGVPNNTVHMKETNCSLDTITSHRNAEFTPTRSGCTV